MISLEQQLLTLPSSGSVGTCSMKVQGMASEKKCLNMNFPNSHFMWRWCDMWNIKDSKSNLRFIPSNILHRNGRYPPKLTSLSSCDWSCRKQNPQHFPSDISLSSILLLFPWSLGQTTNNFRRKNPKIFWLILIEGWWWNFTEII